MSSTPPTVAAAAAAAGAPDGTSAASAIVITPNEEEDESLSLASTQQKQVIVVDEEEEDEEEETLTFLGSVSFTIVGIRYYSGTVHPGEYCTLVREPHNPYDGNAIRVENLHGEKVGHIKKQQAAALAPIMDSLQEQIKVDGTIPYRGNAWTLPVTVELYARNADSETLAQLHTELESFFRDRNQALASKKKKKTKSDGVATPRMERKTIDWRTQQKELDDMFEKQTKEQLSNLPPLKTPIPFEDSTKLFDHQVVGIQWMVHRETGNTPEPFYKKVVENSKHVWLSEITHCSQTNEPKQVKGGILADMGLGKTLQGIGLILSNPPPGHTYPTGVEESGNEASTKMDSTDNDDDVKPSFSVPTSKLAVKKLKTNAIKCILTSAGVAATGKKEDLVDTCWTGLSNGTIAPQHCMDGMDHATAAKTNKTSSGGSVCTLIVSPVSVMSNWVHQIESHVKSGVLRMAVYHGADRDYVSERVKANDVDVLVVSYNTLQADYAKAFPNDKQNSKPSSKKRKRNDTSCLFDMHFHRVILDEAHIIRSMKTRTFKACKSLQSSHRWCLTGTPLQNKPDDICSLWSFLNVESLGERDIFRRAISQPIQAGDETGLARLRAMMAHVALRRNKSVAQLDLPEKQVELCKVSFSKGIHKSIHDTLFRTAKAAFQATLQEGDAAALKNYMSVLETLLRIRQSCCSGALVPKERRKRAEAVLRELEKREGKALSADEGKALLEKLKGTFHSQQNGVASDDEAPECAVCLCEMEESAAVILRTCSHVFCDACITRVTTMMRKVSCPLCRTDFRKSDMIRKSAATKAAASSPTTKNTPMSITQDEIGASPKIAALLEAIKEMKADEKGVIFSQFTKFLDIIEPHLVANGHSFARIDGSKSATDRIACLKSFSSENGPRFMLCSLHAAGTGINLTAANNIFMMDTWWNKAVENQAFDRCHRIGQKRNVRVVRFIMAGSIEERMVGLQEAKAAMGKGAMEKLKPEEVRKARIGDLKSLFDISPTEEIIEVE